MRSTTGKPLSPLGKGIWLSAQAGAFVVTLLVVAGLFWMPDATLRIAWFGIVPILPLSFLVNAGLWRAVCPIATANTLGSNDRGVILSLSVQRRLMAAGMVLLVLLIGARRIVLNTDGPILAGLLLAIVAVSFVTGRLVRAKGGFCNSVCPILPVEKLYGQSPLVHVRNPRCVPCSLCSTRGCLDLNPRRSVDAGSDGRSWMRSPTGLFAAAFPGIILGYFLVADTDWSGTLAVYESVLGTGLASLMVCGAPVALLRIPSRLAAPLLGAVCVGVYYWFAAPASVAAFGGPVVLGLTLRWLLMAFIAFWLLRALRSASSKASR